MWPCHVFQCSPSLNTQKYKRQFQPNPWYTISDRQKLTSSHFCWEVDLYIILIWISEPLTHSPTNTRYVPSTYFPCRKRSITNRTSSSTGTTCVTAVSSQLMTFFGNIEAATDKKWSQSPALAVAKKHHNATIGDNMVMETTTVHHQQYKDGHGQISMSMVTCPLSKQMSKSAAQEIMKILRLLAFAKLPHSPPLPPAELTRLLLSHRSGDSYQLVILSDVELHASTAESYRSSQRKGGSSFVADYTNLNQVETILPQGREVEESVAAAAAILFHNIQY